MGSEMCIRDSVSTAEQSTSRQLADVQLDKVFEEKVSAKTVDRPQLQACLEYVRGGDVLHVHSLDRICRSGAGDAVGLVEQMNRKVYRYNSIKKE